MHENGGLRVSRVAAITRLPHFTDFDDSLPDPSILPLRTKSAATERVERELPCDPISVQPEPWADNFTHPARWLMERLMTDRLLLASWICILVLSVLVVVNPMGNVRSEKVDDLIPLTITHNPSTGELATTPAASEPTPNPFLVSSVASPAIATSAIATTSTDTAITDETALNLQTPSERAVAIEASPWERAVTSGYSPWNPNPATNPSTTPATPSENRDIPVTTSTAVETASYAPAGFAGYDPSPSLDRLSAESEQLVMRPATPLAPQQPIATMPPAPNQQPAAPPANPAYQLTQTRPIYGQVPVAASPQTFRSGADQYAQPIAPQPAPAYAATPNTSPQANYQVAAVPYAPSGYYMPAPNQNGAMPPPQQPQQYQPTPATNNGQQNRAPVIW
ncbi:MAG: hypothetical protein ACRC46_05600 [Thermoguttaceae bacterium]